MIRYLSHIKCLAFAALLIAAPTWAQNASTPPAEKVRIAVMETEVLADLPAEDRKTLAAMIDTIVTTSLSEQATFEMIERQALEKVLAERKHQRVISGSNRALDAALGQAQLLWGSGNRENKIRVRTPTISSVASTRLAARSLI